MISLKLTQDASGRSEAGTRQRQRHDRVVNRSQGKRRAAWQGKVEITQAAQMRMQAGLVEMVSGVEIRDSFTRLCRS